MPEPTFGPDKCQEDKCLEAFLVGQMPVGQMPGVLFWSDKCQAFVPPALVRNKIWSRHLSSWHLSKTKYSPGICPKQNIIQA